MLLKNTKGFTLIELMVVVAIVAILASIAIPSYSKYGFRTRRADAREMLMRVAAAEERFYTNGNTYTATLSALGFSSGL
ncbi:MAG: type IV pilin protein, partial [Dokdonella sp.]